MSENMKQAEIKARRFCVGGGKGPKRGLVFDSLVGAEVYKSQLERDYPGEIYMIYELVPLPAPSPQPTETEMPKPCCSDGGLSEYLCAVIDELQQWRKWGAAKGVKG